MAGNIAEGPALAARDAASARPACSPCRECSRCVHCSGTVMPFLMSRWRWPRVCRSTVSTSALHFAAAARSINERGKAAVFHDVKLEPERLVDGCGDILDRADRHGRQRERNPCRLRGAASQNLPIAVLHTAKADRRQRKRQGNRLADNRRGRGPVRHVDRIRWRSLIASRSVRLALRVCSE